MAELTYEQRIEPYIALASMIRFLDGKPVWKKRPYPYSKNKAGDIAGMVQHNGYRKIALTVNGTRHALSAHRLCFYMTYGFLPEQVDHINRDRDDNRPENLRASNNRLNQINTRKRGGTSSRYKGVCWHKRLKRWQAAIKINGVNIHLGTFKHEDDAACAYNDACKKYGLLEYAVLNRVPPEASE